MRLAFVHVQVYFNGSLRTVALNFPEDGSERDGDAVDADDEDADVVTDSTGMVMSLVAQGARGAG
jgi:hypothetical protein